jgi:hypothetical protein
MPLASAKHFDYFRPAFDGFILKRNTPQLAARVRRRRFTN